MGNKNTKIQDIMDQVHDLTKVASLSYTDFLDCLKKLNLMCHDVSDSQLVFAVKRGTANTVLWRSTIRIAVVLLESNSDDSDSESCLAQRYRLLTLPQFLRVFKAFETQFDAATSAGNSTVMTCSRVMSEVDNLTGKEEKVTECSVCLERTPDIMLPCAHAFCLVCIEQWREYQSNCPVCRERMETTDDAWVISDIPGLGDITNEIRTTLMDLSIPSKNEN